MLNKEFWNKRYHLDIGEKVVGNRNWSNERYAIESKDFVKKVFPILEGLKINNVLDFGCGIGRWTELLVKCSQKYYGIDLTEYAISVCKKQYPDQSFQVFDGDKIPFEDTNFDLIFTCVVLQHVVDDERLEQYIDQFYNRLNDEGYILICENIIKGRDRIDLKFRREEEYLQFFNKFNLRLKDYHKFGKETHILFLFQK